MGIYQSISAKRILKKEYNLLFTHGKRLRSPYHIFFYYNHFPNKCKVAAKKKIGNAVKRNQHKRRLRNILNGIVFKKDYLVLGITSREHQMGFAKEKEIVYHSLRSIINCSN